MAAADRDAICNRLSDLTGLPVLDGWSPGGTLWSRGIRFTNGPFLDIHNLPPDGLEPEPSLLLRGGLREAETLVRHRGWRLTTNLRSDMPQEVASPWSLGYFDRGQGVLSKIGLIEYEIDPAMCGNAEFAGKLFAPDSAPAAGAILERIWIGTEDVDRAEADLACLGFRPAGEFSSVGQPAVGRRLRGETGDVVLCEGGGGVLRLDIAAARETTVLRFVGVTAVLTGGGPSLAAA